MNWEIIGSTGEWAGAIAVVATLFYLARQIKQQNLNTERATEDSILDGFNQVNSILASSDELSGIFLTGLHSPEELTDNQAAQFQWMFRLYFNGYFKIYTHYKRGLLEESYWRDQASQGSWFLNTPGGKIFRAGHGDAFKEEFEAISSAVRDQPTVDLTLGRSDSFSG